MAGCELREVGWRFYVSPKYPCQPSEDNNYIDVPTNEETNQKIISALSTLQVFRQSTLVQRWAPEVNGKTCLLVTRGQLFGFCGINEELESHHEAWLDKKLYVYLPKVFKDQKKGEDTVYEDIAYGLPGRVFLKCEAEYQPPECKDGFFSKKWGSFALPLIEGDKCVGVLEFIMDKTQVSSEDETIDQVDKALKNAGFQSIQISRQSIQRNRPTPTYFNPRKRSRTTKSCLISSYEELSPYFGLPSNIAAKKVSIKHGHDFKEGTFKNSCRDARIPEWPGKRGNSSRISSVQTKRGTKLEPSGYNNALFSQNHLENHYSEPMQDHLFGTPTNQTSYQTSLSEIPLAFREEDLTIPLDFMLYNNEMNNESDEVLDMLKDVVDDFLNFDGYPDNQV